MTYFPLRQTTCFFIPLVAPCKPLLIIVNSGADLKVQFVSSFGDYKVKVSNNSSFASETIKIKIVDSFADVKLQKVTSFGDFEAYFD